MHAGLRKTFGLAALSVSALMLADAARRGRRASPTVDAARARLAAAEAELAALQDAWIAQLTSPRRALFAFEVDGRIGRTEIEAMVRVMLAAFEAMGEVDMLIRIRRFEGVEIGAVFDRLRLQAQLQALRHVGRYAVVGPPAWAAVMIEAFDVVAPLEARAFAPEDEAAAWAWASRASDEA